MSDGVTNDIMNELVIAFQAVCCILFYRTFGQKRFPEKRWLDMVILISMVLSFEFFRSRFFTDIFSFLQANAPIEPVSAVEELLFAFIGMIPVITILMCIYVKISSAKSIVMSALFSIFLLVIVYFGNLLLETERNTIFSGMNADILLFFSHLTALGILFAVGILMCGWQQKHKSSCQTDYAWMQFVFLPVYIALTVILLFVVKPEGTLLYMMAGGLLVMDIILVYMIHNLKKQEEKARETEVFLLQAKHQTEMYRSISENFEQERRKTHEYKNQITCIDSLLSSGKYGELEEYLGELNGKIKKELDAIDTNHTIINAILNTKYQEAVEKGITMVFRMGDLSEITVRDEDIVVILSNLINNAIEACEKCREQRVIWVKFVKEDDCIILSVKNTYDGVLRYGKNGEIRTLKKERPQEHGIGIKNIIAVIEKYEGSYVMKDMKKEFFVSVLIPQ